MKDKEVVEEKEEEGISKFCYILTHRQRHSVQYENREHPQFALYAGHALWAWGGLVQFIKTGRSGCYTPSFCLLQRTL